MLQHSKNERDLALLAKVLDISDAKERELAIVALPRSRRGMLCRTAQTLVKVLMPEGTAGLRAMRVTTERFMPESANELDEIKNCMGPIIEVLRNVELASLSLNEYRMKEHADEKSERPSDGSSSYSRPSADAVHGRDRDSGDRDRLAVELRELLKNKLHRFRQKMDNFATSPTGSICSRTTAETTQTPEDTPRTMPATPRATQSGAFRRGGTDSSLDSRANAPIVDHEAEAASCQELINGMAEMRAIMKAARKARKLEASLARASPMISAAFLERATVAAERGQTTPSPLRELYAHDRKLREWLILLPKSVRGLLLSMRVQEKK